MSALSEGKRGEKALSTPYHYPYPINTSNQYLPINTSTPLPSTSTPILYPLSFIPYPGMSALSEGKRGEEAIEAGMDAFLGKVRLVYSYISKYSSAFMYACTVFFIT
jgi:hypothetical protein